MSKKAIFFDRDETLLHDSHYMYKPEQLSYINGVFDVLSELITRGYDLFIFSNQSGIGRGYFTVEHMNEFHKVMQADFKKHNIFFKEILYCPHAPIDECDCRKPSPKILIEACEKYDLDPKLCYMVGDRESDVLAGERAGMTGVGINVDCKNRISTLSELLTLIE